MVSTTQRQRSLFQAFFSIINIGAYEDWRCGAKAAPRILRVLLISLACVFLSALNQTAQGASETSSSSQIELSPSQARWLGQQVFANECASKLSCLTSWNAGEDFPSLGIGHFIWYQREQSEAFEETFPSLLSFLTQKGVTLPPWLIALAHQPSPNDRNGGQFSAENSSALLNADSPWPSREAFLEELDGPRLRSLRELLATTQAEQAEFIIHRFHSNSTRIVAAAPANERDIIDRRLRALMQDSAPAGLYALIDYVHFKGTGLQTTERYNGQGWGLLQVLQGMDDKLPPLESFINSAQERLTTRVANAPAERQEQRWLKGWLNRLETYSQAAKAEL